MQPTIILHDILFIQLVKRNHVIQTTLYDINKSSMTKLLHSNKMILNRIYLLVSSSGTRVNSSTTTTGNQNDKSTLFEPHIEPVTLAYSSYETTSSEITAAPVIIMHGNCLIFRSNVQ